MIDDLAIREFVLAFADDEHLMGQQHTEWIGVAPFLEEDLAFASIGQDELGHAAMLYALVDSDDDAAIDALAFRDAEHFRSCHLVEYATTDWAEALTRHWMYDAAEELRWAQLANSSIPVLVDMCVRAGREESYHRRHADVLLDALMADDEARARIVVACERLVPMALGMFEPVAGEAAAIAAGVVETSFADARSGWASRLRERFGIDAESYEPVDQAARTGRSDDFEPLLARMREVIDLDPAAVW